MSKVFHSIATLIVFLFFLPQSGFTAEKKMDVAVLEFEVKGDIGIKDAGAIIAECGYDRIPARHDGGDSWQVLVGIQRHHWR